MPKALTETAVSCQALHPNRYVHLCIEHDDHAVEEEIKNSVATQRGTNVEIKYDVSAVDAGLIATALERKFKSSPLAQILNGRIFEKARTKSIPLSQFFALHSCVRMFFLQEYSVIIKF